MVILMRWKGILLMVLTLVIVILLTVYLFIPYNVTELSFTQSDNPNFNIDGTYVMMQFYENMRFSSTSISYKIAPDCTLSKKASMEQAFEILENETILDFYPVSFGEEILIQCDSTAKIDGGMFIAGEGGPTNITVAGDLNIISSGKILLLREPKCTRPNVALHELLHVLGFDHSDNEDNIMFEITKCKQTIGEDIPGFINEIYAISPLPDLTFEDAEGYMTGKYLNSNLSVRNQGIMDSPDSVILLYADDKLVKEIALESLGVGYGTKISLYNIWVNKIGIDTIKFVINSSFEEMSTSNNEIVLSLKK
jgi:hypothetical protein